MTSLQLTQLEGWLELFSIIVNFLNHGNTRTFQTTHQSPTAVFYEQEKYSGSVSQQPIPESSQGSKTKTKQTKSLNLKNLIPNTK